MKKLLLPFIIVLFVLPTGAIADGRADYRARCAACHAASPMHYPDLEKAWAMKVNPKKLALSASEMNREEMIAITSKGKGKMPGYEDKLTADQISAIVDYILSVTKKK